MTTATATGLRLSVLQKPLAAALAAVNRIAKGTHLPITLNVMLTATEGVLTLRATNLEQQITVTVGAKCEGEGTVMVEAARLHALVGTLPDDRVDLTVTDRTLLLACGRTKARFPLADPADFPPAPEMTGEPLATVGAGALRTAIKRVLPAAATDVTRPVLTAVFVQFGTETADLAAANGFALSVTRMALASGPKTKRDLLIPATALRELDRLLGGEGAVEITADANRVRFRVGATELTAQLVQGNFPNYPQLIPAWRGFGVTVDAEEFARAVRNCAVMGLITKDGGSISVRFEAMPGEVGSLRLWSGQDEGGANETIIDAVIEGEPPSKIALAEDQMSGVLGVMTGKIVMEWNSALAPAVFSPVVGGREEMLAVVMPMFVKLD